MSEKLSPYQRIVRASKKGVGVRLSVEECFDLAHNPAIIDRAEFEDEGMNLPPDDGWQDDRIYTNNERQLDTRIDCHIGRREAA